MMQIDEDEQQIKKRIKHLWHNLTDEEISYHAVSRDVFFLAVRKKYGLTRAQAEEVLRNPAHVSYDEVA